MTKKETDDLTKAIRSLANQFYSPNCHDSNFEPANVVDGLYMIAKSIFELADAVKEIGKKDTE